MKLPNRNFAQPGAYSATLVVPVRSTESPRTRPCTAKSVPSVTMSDGTAVRTTRMPLISPTSNAERQRRGHADDDRRAEVAGDDRDRHSAGRDHRADRDVELAGDHQQTDRERDDAEVRGDVEIARGPGGRDEVHAAEDRKEHEDEEEAEERAGLGTAKHAAEGKFTGLRARVARVVPDFCRVWVIICCPCVQDPMTVCASAAIQVRLAG